MPSRRQVSQQFTSRRDACQFIEVLQSANRLIKVLMRPRWMDDKCCWGVSVLMTDESKQPVEYDSDDDSHFSLADGRPTVQNDLLLQRLKAVHGQPRSDLMGDLDRG